MRYEGVITAKQQTQFKNKPDNILIYAILTAVVVILTAFSRGTDNAYMSAFLFLLQQMVYMGMITVWGLTLRQGILDSNIGRELTIATALMLLWLLLRAARYRFFDSFETFTRYLWYLYYIPIILLPTLFFMISLEISNRKDKKRIRQIVLGLAFLLIVAILTNDLHGLAFYFTEAGDYNHYRYGAFYYVVALDILVNFVGGIILIAHNKKHLRPLLWLVVLGIYCVLYAWRPGILSLYHLINLPEAFCLIFLGIIESSVRCGLILTNQDYPKFFHSVSIPAIIADQEDNPVYYTAYPMVIDEDHLLRHKALQGGTIYWTEDLGKIHMLNRELSEVREELNGSNELLLAENRLLAEKIRVEEQNRLYDEMDLLTEQQRKKIRDLLKELLGTSPDYNSRMALACIYNAYIKRRSNLALLAGAGKYISSRELYYCFKESGEYLSLYGIPFDENRVEEVMLPAEELCLVYDFFEGLIEENLDKLQAIMVHTEKKGQGLQVRLLLEGTEGLAIPETFSYDFLREDNTSYITLKLGRWQ